MFPDQPLARQSRLGTLVVGDPNPLLRLAETGRLDALLKFDHIVIVDEMVFEATQQFAAAHPEDPDYLRRWIDTQVGRGRVSIPVTWVGEAAEEGRAGALPLAAGRRLGAVAVSNYFRDRHEAGNKDGVTVLVDDDPRITRSRRNDSTIQSVDIKSRLFDVSNDQDEISS